MSMTTHAPRFIDSLTPNERLGIQLLAASVLARAHPSRTPVDLFHEVSELGYREISHLIRQHAALTATLDAALVSNSRLTTLLDRLTDHEVWTVLLDGTTEP